jgi:hypothetical protein
LAGRTEAGASGPVVRPLSSRTTSEKYVWFNNVISVGVGRRLTKGPIYQMFEIL